MANHPNPTSLWNFPLSMVTTSQTNSLDSSQSSSLSMNLGDRKQKTLRLSINARERRRMHDLNDALDELRSVVCSTTSISTICFLSIFHLDSIRTFSVRKKIE